MRQIVLDTETTGLEVSEGHRLIEIGCVELVSRRPTGRHFHRYLNPEREIDVGATEVHGFTLEKLQGEPRFADVVEEFLAFVEGAELIIHNAPFDLGFLNAELGRWCEAVSRKRLVMERQCTVVDTLALARSRHPGQRNSLDALCKRYGVDNARRDLHGALLDAEILAEVYLAMTGGQSALELKESISAGAAIKQSSPLQRWVRPAGVIPVIEPSPEELALHEALMVNVKS
ncbi:MAG: DNA polymerase III subunit epsilon [Gammaproteobacteria bacterium]|nr:DNA polymerase III subunit epsilon [Gammaproteobacteria bacterium]